jgi:hypothetical protein
VACVVEGGGVEALRAWSLQLLSPIPLELLNYAQVNVTQLFYTILYATTQLLNTTELLVESYHWGVDNKQYTYIEELSVAYLSLVEQLIA